METTPTIQAQKGAGIIRVTTPIIGTTPIILRGAGTQVETTPTVLNGIGVLVETTPTILGVLVETTPTILSGAGPLMSMSDIVTQVGARLTTPTLRDIGMTIATENTPTITPITMGTTVVAIAAAAVTIVMVLAALSVQDTTPHPVTLAPPPQIMATPTIPTPSTNHRQQRVKNRPEGVNICNYIVTYILIMITGIKFML